METNELQPIVEAMIFVSDEPVTDQAIINAINLEGVTKATVREVVDAIKNDYNENASRGLTLSEIAGGYQFRTKETAAEWVKRLFADKPIRLSPAALETMAIVAYRQPIIRAEVEHVRGVDSGGVLKTLVEKKLVRIMGKRDEPGQPLIYGTTKEFMEIFGLSSLKEVPPLTDLKELAERHLVSQSGEESTADESVGEEEPMVPAPDQEVSEEKAAEVMEKLERDEKADQEALSTLESSLKGLRKLEKFLFPKPVPTVPQQAEGTSDGTANASGEDQPQSEAAPEAEPKEVSAGNDQDAADERAPEQTDRTDNRTVATGGRRCHSQGGGDRKR